MKSYARSYRRFFAALGLAAVLAAGFALTSQLRGQEQRGGGAPAGGAAPNLERNMSAMNRAWRTIKAGAGDKTKNEATLAALAQMQATTVAAKVQTPATVEKLAGDEKVKKLAEYRKDIIKLIRQELDLEEVLLSGDNDKAKDLITAIDDTQKAGHKEFRAAD